jgi:tagatose 6-phosphate kinase
MCTPRIGCALVILTVTLNLALDVTYRVPAVNLHAANRVSSVAGRAGGKGVNVGRILQELGQSVVVSGLVGGLTGDAVIADLHAAGIEAALTPIAGETRRTLAVVDDATGDATGFWEPGPAITDDEWRAFLAAYERLAGAADAVVLSGSLPPGAPADAYAQLCRVAQRAGIPAVLDADGEALRLGLAGNPTLVKPNRDELARAAGTTDPVLGAQALRAAGAGAVVVSSGPDGLLAVTPEGTWSARPPERVAGNPTGAGDAAVAALTAGLVTAAPWPERLENAVALSAAAVAAPLAGAFDDALYRRHLAAVSAEQLAHPPSVRER